MKIKDIAIREEKVKSSLFEEDMTVFIENQKNPPKKTLLELIIEFSKITGHKINYKN